MNRTRRRYLLEAVAFAAALIAVLGIAAMTAQAGKPAVSEKEMDGLITNYRNANCAQDLQDEGKPVATSGPWQASLLPPPIWSDGDADGRECPKLTTFSPASLASWGGSLFSSTESEAAPAHADGGGKALPAHHGMSAAEIANELNNPGTDLASLVFQLTWNQFEGDLPGSSSQDSLALAFQPIFPFRLSRGETIIVRPNIPVVWQPNYEASKGGFGEQFGLGDIQLDVFRGRTNAKKTCMWGAGAVLQFPTHTDSALGKDQFAMGPAAYAGIMGKWGSAGLFPQHYWNIGGSGGYTATTLLQPWYWFSLGKGWQIGGSPIITYDWAADNSNQAWTVPVNFGLSKTIMVGKIPIQLKLEAIYYIVQPDEFGSHWGLQFSIVPVVPNVIEGLFK